MSSSLLHGVGRSSAVGACEPLPELTEDREIRSVSVTLGSSIDNGSLGFDEFVNVCVDRFVCEQIPGVHAALLGDTMAAVFCLVMGSGCPIELNETDIARGGERDANAGRPDVADDELSGGVVLEPVDRLLSFDGGSAATDRVR